MNSPLVIFQDFKKSRSNDQFALTIKNAGDQFSSFSIVRNLIFISKNSFVLILTLF